MGRVGCEGMTIVDIANDGCAGGVCCSDWLNDRGWCFIYANVPRTWVCVCMDVLYVRSIMTCRVWCCCRGLNNLTVYAREGCSDNKHMLLSR